MAGPFCANSGTTFQQNGWFDQGQAGWVTNSGNSGCGGQFNSMPMSGASGKDSGNSVVWTFSTGAVTSGSCTLSVYVPGNGDVKAVGGAPAYYTVQTGSSPGSGTIGSFTVNQVGNRGAWVNAGTYPVSNGRIGVMLHDRGQDWTNTTKTYAHLAAAAVKANCTG
ncbi:hypothetical protein [Kitasatospora mediocidica]|uniref:hypothetical protein n=1 Tax=Kitasatospora mediocidica TaxID=58352 RepID=UPI000569A4F0|nr:hypothetical protein [Kitasatospora mediocidica]